MNCCAFATGDEIFNAIAANDMSQLKLAVERDPTGLYARNYCGAPPLRVAVELRHREMVSFLIDRGCPLSEHSTEDGFPLSVVAAGS